MDPVIAYCGLTCDSCPIHLATLETEKIKQAQMRIDIAEQLAKVYGTTSKPEIITDCEGCKKINGKLFEPCNQCAIRNCAIERNMINCAYCTEFVCDKLEKHYKYDPESRDRLLEIRGKIARGY